VSGVLGSISTGYYALDTGSGFPSGTTITINVAAGGFITGCGGGTWQQTSYTFSPNNTTYNYPDTGARGGTYDNIGTADPGFPSRGGPAIILRYNTTINNSGVIQGGGGAGGVGGNIYFGGGCGWWYGSDFWNQTDLGVPGSNYPGAGSLQIGAPYQRDPYGGTNNGGCGGGWQSDTYSPSIYGYGYGSPGKNANPGTVNGGAAPGHSIDGYSYVAAGSNTGLLRGSTQSTAASSAVAWTYLGTNTSFLAYSYDGVHAPPGVGGGGGGGGGGPGCPDPATPIMVTTSTSVAAGSLLVGDIIYTMHDITREYGYYKVLYAAIEMQPKLRLEFENGKSIVISTTHRFLMATNTWNSAFNLKIGDSIRGVDSDNTIVSIDALGEGPVVKFEIEDAHTYISSGLISHNAKVIDPLA
jgi:hypothetical protein